MQSWTYPSRAAQAGIRLPPTLEADKPGYLASTLSISFNFNASFAPQQIT